MTWESAENVVLSDRDLCNDLFLLGLDLIFTKNELYAILRMLVVQLPTKATIVLDQKKYTLWSNVRQLPSLKINLHKYNALRNQF